jgi:Domain of unknown function (DUF6456)
MPRRRSERAQRRIAERTRRNVLALEAIAVEAEERPLRPKWARHKTQIEVMEGRGVLSPRQCAAAWRVYRDFAAAGDLPHLVAKYAPRTDQPARGQMAFRSWEPSQIEARRRFEQAMLFLGPLSGIVLHVAVLDLPTVDWHRPRDAVPILRLALDALADHYKLPDSDGIVGRIDGGAVDLSTSNAALRLSETVTAPLTVASQ